LGRKGVDWGLQPRRHNVFSRVPLAKVREVAVMLKAVHASEDLMATRQQAV
jgi:hypothetical protein